MKPVRYEGRTELVGEIAGQAQLHGLLTSAISGSNESIWTSRPTNAPTNEPSGSTAIASTSTSCSRWPKTAMPKSVLGASLSPKWRLTTSHAASSAYQFHLRLIRDSTSSSQTTADRRKLGDSCRTRSPTG
jgi:hypothetical protein